MKFDRFFRLSNIPGAGVHCSPQGLFVGQTQLLERVRVEDGRLEWRVRPANELRRGLSKSYAIPIELKTKMSGLAAVARALGSRLITSS